MAGLAMPRREESGQNSRGKNSDICGPVFEEGLDTVDRARIPTMMRFECSVYVSEGECWEQASTR
ncbi:hypothetical protein ES702_06465 [subsurface metagenome]